MKRFIEGENRFQSTLFPESLEDYIAKDNSIRVVDAFVDKLKLKELGFDRAEPSDTGRPGYMTYQCSSCPLKSQCTTGKAKRIKRWEKEDILDAADALLKQNPDAMRQRKQLVEHPFGTIKHWMGSTHFLMKRLPNVQAEMSLHVLAYNMRRAINVLGVAKIMKQLEVA